MVQTEKGGGKNATEVHEKRKGDNLTVLWLYVLFSVICMQIRQCAGFVVVTEVSKKAHRTHIEGA